MTVHRDKQMESDTVVNRGVVNSVEFVVPRKSVNALAQNASRVKRLFNVEFKFANKFERGNESMQWINVIGVDSTSKEMPEKAKTYIISMTNPEARITMENVSPSLYQSSVGNVEKETCAFLTQIGNSIAIQGSQLAVVLAQSMLENMQQESASKKAQSQDSSVSKMEVDGESLFVEDVTRKENAVYMKTSIDSQQLSSHRSPQDPRSGRQPSHHSSLSKNPLVPPASADFDSTAKKLFFVDRAGTHNADFRPNEPISSNGNNNTNAAVGTMNDEDDVDGGLNPEVAMVNQYESLKRLGLSQQFHADIIEEGLKRCDMTDIVRPADFLNILTFISKTQRDSNSVSSSGSQNQSSSIVDQSSLNRVRKKDEASRPSSSKEDSVICIHSDSENDGGSEVMNDIHAYVISSDEEETPITAKKVERILGGKKKQKTDGFRNPFPVSVSGSSGSQPYQRQNVAAPSTSLKGALRHIVIDGNNVAMHHGDHKVYSVRGIQICIDYFLKRGHKVTAFVSGSRRYYQPRKAFPIRDKQLLTQLESEGHLKFTPSRRLDTGKIICSYDDRFVLNLADAEGGIVVSNDQYRDLLHEKPSYRDLIENRLLPFMFVGDLFMPPDDPLGRDGPTLDQFLRVGGETAVAARGAGVPNRSRTAPAAAHQEEKGAGQPSKYMQWAHPAPAPTRNFWQVHSEEERKETSKDQALKNLPQRKPNMGVLQNAHGLQLRSGGSNLSAAAPLRSERKTKEMFTELSLMFPEPGQQQRLMVVLQNHPEETDLTRMCNYVINALTL